MDRQCGAMVDLPAHPPDHPGMDRRRFLRCLSPWSPFPKETAAFALRRRLPTMTLIGPVGQVGRLIADGANFGEQVLRVASYLDRMLTGAKPAELPFASTTGRADSDMKTAKALGFTLPLLLTRADQVIE
jgi:putative ABC transport system substrate-binding protein